MANILSFNVMERPFCYYGNKNTLPRTPEEAGLGLASVNNGFPPECSKPVSDGGVPPNRYDMNGALYFATQIDYYIQKGGTFTFNSDVSDAIGGYPAGAILSYVDPSDRNKLHFIKCLKNNNTRNFIENPSYIDGEYWEDITPIPEKRIEVYPGTIIWYAGRNLPSGYLRCRGGKVSKTTYADLYAVIGNTFGSGTPTTFHLPELKNHYIRGAQDDFSDLGTKLSAQLPNLKGVLPEITCTSGSPSGVFSKTGSILYNENYDSHTDHPVYKVNFNANSYNDIYQDNAIVQPSTIPLVALIKY